MLVAIPNVLTPEQVTACTAQLERATWADGRESAGYLSQPVKNNSQLADDDPLARELGDTILRALEKNSRFFAAALPLKVLPPLFNRYAGEQAYGRHIDGAILARRRYAPPRADGSIGDVVLVPAGKL